MNITILNEKLDKVTFNQKAPHPLQSWQWGEGRKEMGIKILRIAEYTNNQIINVFQLTFHKIPYTNLKIGYLPRSKFPSKQILEFLYDYGKKNNVIFIKIEPYVENFKFQISNFKLIKSPHRLFPNWTQIIDLTKSEDELLKNMKSKTRYNIHLAEKKGVYVKEISNDEGFKIFSKLYFETCRRQKYFGHSEKYHKILWNKLKHSIAHILIAFYNSTPLAVYELFHFNDTLYYPYGGTSLQYRNFMASNLLMWEAVKIGKKLAAKKFDLWGSLQPDYDVNDPWSGFTKFKEGYGGKFVEFVGSYDLVINPLLYQLYNIVDILRNNFLALKRLI